MKEKIEKAVDLVLGEAFLGPDAEHRLNAVGFNRFSRGDAMAYAGAPSNSYIYHGDYFDIVLMPSENELEISSHALIDVGTVNISSRDMKYRLSSSDTFAKGLANLVSTLKRDSAFRNATKAYEALWDKGRAYVDAHPDEDREAVRNLDDAVQKYYRYRI